MVKPDLPKALLKFYNNMFTVLTSYIVGESLENHRPALYLDND